MANYRSSILSSALLTVLLLSQPWAAAGDAAKPPETRGAPGMPTKQVFACDFTKPLAKTWRMIGGTWALRDGCLKMTDPGNSDPTKALILVGEGPNVSSDIVITAKVRLDTWANDDWARAGVGVCADPATGLGPSLVVSRGKLTFVHDYVATFLRPGPEVQVITRVLTLPA